jgi:hypothetical protein
MLNRVLRAYPAFLSTLHVPFNGLRLSLNINEAVGELMLNKSSETIVRSTRKSSLTWGNRSELIVNSVSSPPLNVPIKLFDYNYFRKLVTLLCIRLVYELT